MIPVLFLLGRFRPRVACARILDRQVEGGRTAPIHQQGIGTPVDEGGDRGEASGPYRSMQRRDTALVDGVRVGAGIDEVRDDLLLRIRIQEVRAQLSIRGVVERFGSPSVAGANRGAMGDEHRGESPVMGGGGDMQCRVSRVDVVTNRNQEVRAGILTARSDPKRQGGQARCSIEHSRDPNGVTRRDRREERTQRTVVELVGSPTCLRHGHRLAGHAIVDSAVRCRAHQPTARVQRIQTRRASSGKEGVEPSIVDPKTNPPPAHARPTARTRSGSGVSVRLQDIHG